jgi:hypothetical protein
VSPVSLPDASQTPLPSCTSSPAPTRPGPPIGLYQRRRARSP